MHTHTHTHTHTQTHAHTHTLTCAHTHTHTHTHKELRKPLVTGSSKGTIFCFSTPRVHQVGVINTVLPAYPIYYVQRVRVNAHFQHAATFHVSRNFVLLRSCHRFWFDAAGMHRHTRQLQSDGITTAALRQCDPVHRKPASGAGL